MNPKFNKSSMFYWWPKIAFLPIPKPRTILIRHEGAFKGKLSYDPIDRKPEQYFDEMLIKVQEAADKMGYPIFIRSDEYSGKHGWENTCYVERRDQLGPHILQILEETAMIDLSFFGIAVREFLQLDWRFKSHSGKMPVAAERRYFVRDDRVECWHPYWPPASIEEPSIKNWQELLKELQTANEGEVELLTGYAKLIGKTLGGYWSVDFCRTIRNEWYLTDMAEGEKSYHWATCPNAPSYMLERYGDPEEVNP